MSASVWKKCRLGDIAVITRGGNFQKSDFIPEGKPCIHYGQMYTHFGAYTEDVLTYISDKSFSNSQIAVQNDVVMAITSETVEDVCSCVAWLGEDDIAVSGHTVIIHHDQDPKYLSYFFHSNQFFKQKSRVAHGSKVIEVNPDELKASFIIFPTDIKEQKRIASILSTCDTVIQKTQSTIEKYKAIKQGMMQDLFTRGLTKDGKLRPSFKDAPELYKESELGMIPKEWEVKTVGSVCSIKGRIGFRGYTMNDLVEKGYGAITLSPSNILESNIMNYDKCSYISWFKYEESPEIKIFNGDILVVKTGSTFGKSSIVKNLPQEATINPQFVVLKEIKINNDFLSFVFANGIIQKQIMKNVVGGAIPTLSQEVMSNFILPSPSISEQNKIASMLNSIDSTIQKEEALLAKYKKIKNGLMNNLLVPPKDATIIDETGDAE